MSELSYRPITSVPCTVCGAPSIRITSWPDGRYWSTCPDHENHPTQIGIWIEETGS